MLTLSELKTLIHKEEEKRDLLYEHSPGNMSVFKKMCEGTFEAVETGDEREKCLIPQVAAFFPLMHIISLSYALLHFQELHTYLPIL